jgi:ABC-type nitrate/sulfonate/bicarbonate transport system ATPase subunit
MVGKERSLMAKDITRIYQDEDGNDILALSGLNLEIIGGQIVALVGPSGCGKSTFLRLVAGLDKPQSGTLAYNGEIIAGHHHDRGFVFQDASLFPWLTVYENIAFGLKARNVYKQEKAKVREYIALMGLQGFENSFPHQISGGMASRTALARTYIQDPGLILLDEPLSALDAFTRMAIQDEIIKTWKCNQPIIILVTHDIEEAVYLSDRVVVLSSRPGKVIGEVPIPIQHPRDRTGPEFVQLRREIMGMLECCNINNNNKQVEEKE